MAIFPTVTDRNVQYPNRFKMTLVDGTTDTYDVAPEPGTITSAGTSLNGSLFGQIKTYADGLGDATFKTALLDAAYPVGSIYETVSTATTCPIQTTLGGTWVRIEDKFLLSAGSTYSAGTTGGQATQFYNYKVASLRYYGAAVGEDATGIRSWNYQTSAWVNASNVGQCANSVNAGMISGVNSASPLLYSSEGTTAAKSILPPYLSVYVWKRTV